MQVLSLMGQITVASLAQTPVISQQYGRAVFEQLPGMKAWLMSAKSLSYI